MQSAHGGLGNALSGLGVGVGRKRYCVHSTCTEWEGWQSRLTLYPHKLRHSHEMFHREWQAAGGCVGYRLCGLAKNVRIWNLKPGLGAGVAEESSRGASRGARLKPRSSLVCREWGQNEARKGQPQDGNAMKCKRRKRPLHLCQGNPMP
jgi:hypothetical protein